VPTGSFWVVTEFDTDVDADKMASDPDVLNDVNRKVVEEFRANSGKVGGLFAGSDIVLLTTVGAKSGTPRVSPLVYFDVDGRILIAGSFGGSPKAPAWVHNLRAQSSVRVEIGTDAYDAEASELPLEERNALYPRVVEIAPQFGDYQAKTSRVIPLFELTRV
jgi:deazaflavin-dependent oxidoreductase (nitroreductase family)